MNGDNQKQAALDKDGAGWSYKPAASVPTQRAQEMSAPAPQQGEVIWTASEFIAHNKSLGWYSLLALAAVALAALVYLLTKDLVSVSIIIFVALVLGVAAKRKPRVLNYQLNGSGIAIGQKFYAYHEFRSFSVMQEGAFSSIMFIPLKRFMPTISIYYDPQDEERIVQMLSYYLPLENHTRDAVDSLIHHIRF